MKISGFSFARNADKLYYPVAESIRSILPICDEFVVAIGKGDAGDRTRDIVAGIGDSRIKIVDTDWSKAKATGSAIYAQQTDVALEQCTGDWCFYIQADEVVHERYLDTIKARCRQLADDREVEGLLFGYKHFWGDYDHYVVSHAWYPREIRVIRNGLGIRSYRDAQSFRLDGRKVKVAYVDAEVFHYGWVRPPYLMNKKRDAFGTTCHGKQWRKAHKDSLAGGFDYGPLAKLPRYTGSHPQVLVNRVAQCDWKGRLDYGGRSSVRHKHDRFKYRLLTFIEQKLLRGNQLGGFKNYELVRRG